MRSTLLRAAAVAVAAVQVVGAIDLKSDNSDSVKKAASTIAKDLWSYYKGNSDPSQIAHLPKPYFWWEAGAMFGTMISYSYLTGDKQYNDDIAKAIYSQASKTNDFMMMDTEAFNLGNDDQGFWALTAMSAAEHNLAPPPGAPSDIWLTLASGAFNDLASRWNTSFCGGGIKWQFIQANNGYKYKSSIANGVTMQLGARLALFTGNQTYADKAAMFYNWMHNVGFISDDFQVFDGAGDDPDNCTKIDNHEWSYNSGAILGGVAAMANYTASKGSPDAKAWADRTAGIWRRATENFFQNGVLYEQPCEGVDTCNNDQWSFKAYLARWATFAAQVQPGIMGDVQSKLRSTADAIAKSCTGNGGSACGTKWYNGNYNDKTGVGQEMSALEVVVGLLAPNVPFQTGHASSNAGSGSGSSSSSSPAPTSSSAPASSSAAAAASTSSPAPSSSSAAAQTSSVPTTMATSTIAASPSADSNNKVAAPSSTGGAAPQPSQQSAGASPYGASSGSGSPKPVMIGANGVPFCTEAVV